MTKFQELGDSLRRRREQDNLEIGDIALRIKVSARNLQAIEAGSLVGLPQPVFTRGFIRSYAKMLNMDLGEVEALLKEAFPDEMVNNISAERTTDAREQSMAINTPVVPRKVFAALGLLLLLGAIGAGVWLYLGGLDKLSGGEAQAAGEAARQAFQAGESARIGEAGTPADGGEAAGDPFAAAPPPAEDGPAPAEPPAAQSPAAAAVQPGQAEPGQTVRATAAQHQVRINVLSGRSWVGIQADGNAHNFELRAGGSYLLEFNRNAIVTLGNAAGVQVTYNGRRLPFTAREGEVKVLHFPPTD